MSEIVAMCSDAWLSAPLELHRDLVLPGNSKVQSRLTNLDSLRLLYFGKYHWAFTQKEIAAARLGSAWQPREEGGGVQRVRWDKSWGGEHKKAIKESGKRSQRERDRNKRSETRTMNYLLLFKLVFLAICWNNSSILSALNACETSLLMFLVRQTGQVSRPSMVFNCSELCRRRMQMRDCIFLQSQCKTVFIQFILWRKAILVCVLELH